VTGFLGPVADVDALAGEAIALLSDPPRYAAMSAASRARSVALFDADSVVARYLALYERVLSG